MQRQVVRLTRQELYEKMWSRPAISLAEEFGISGRGLGKICSRFEIPVPSPRLLGETCGREACDQGPASDRKNLTSLRKS